MTKVIDLFAGAGGLSLGAARAGFKVVAAVEKDKFAIETHARNFPSSKHLELDVGSLTGKDLLQMAGVIDGELTGLIGGPPCQGFSNIGHRNADDGRNSLFDHFFRLVSETRPAFFVAENVPGILDPKYSQIREKAFAHVDREMYELLPPLLVKADEFGAPTIRKRYFFVGFDPKRFATALNTAAFLPSPATEKVVVSTALFGLPEKIDSRWQTEAQGLRELEGFGRGRYFERISNLVPEGVGDQITLENYFGRCLVSGCLGTKHTSDVKARFRRLQYGESDQISRATRLDPNGFCPTLRAGTASDKGSFQAVRPVHFAHPRVITPREAARLQGFPDWFEFHKTKWHSFRQIGNSVSPIVSEAILTTIYQHLVNRIKK